MKYVNHEDLGIVIFPNVTSHAKMARMLGGRITSAGFVDMGTGECFGRSETLNLNSDEKDTRLLRAAMAVFN